MVSDEKIINGLISTGYCVRKTAQELKISEGTIYRRMQNKAFKTAYKSAQDELLRNVIGKASANLTNGIATVCEIMQNKENAPQIRLNASQILFNTFIRLNEQCEILTRLEKLESMNNGD